MVTEYFLLYTGEAVSQEHLSHPMTEGENLSLVDLKA